MMDGHYFLRFVLRRCQCATMLFLGVLAILYVSTSVYYAIRISVVERPGAFASIEAQENVNCVTQRLLQRAVPLEEDAMHLFPSPGAATIAPTHGPNRSSHNSSIRPGLDRAPAAAPRSLTAPRQTLHRSSRGPYEQPYKVLQPGTPMMQQRMRNPTLPAEVPLWEPAAEGEAGRSAVPSRQRYVLDGLSRGDRYMLRLSYLGSPSVGFDMRLYQVRRSEVRRLASAAAASATRGFEVAPQDTELLVFSTSEHNALEFSAEEDVWLDKSSAESDAALDPVAMRRAMDEAVGTEDPFVPVVEVRTRVLSIPIDAHRLPVVRFNIELDRMRPPFLPQVAVPLMTYSVWVLIFLGYVGVYTLVSSGIASGEPVKPHDE